MSHGDAQEIHDVLLLSRPDYTLFDEMRNTNDFKLFADLRLSGIGLAGVVHATNPIDAIQRFVGRIELGVIPHIIDTVFFIKNGFIDKVLSLQMVVKVPSGMIEADLARPVVVVTDFETKKLEFELYSYGEETVVIPVGNEEQKKTSTQKIAEKTLQQEFYKFSKDARVEIIDDHNCAVYVPEHMIARMIGKEGSNIKALEEKLGIHIDVRELDETSRKEELKGDEIDFDSKVKNNSVLFYVDTRYEYKDVNLYIGDDYLLTVKVGKSGVIKIKKNNKIGKMLMDAVNSGDKVRLVV